MPGVIGGENSAPIGIGPGVRIGRSRAGLDLIQVDGLTHAVGIHTDITLTQGDIAKEFAFHGQIPLRGLRVAVIGESVLIEVSCTGDERRGIRGSDTGELIGRIAVDIGIQSCAHHGYVNIRCIERELTEVGTGEKPQPGAQDGLTVSKRAIGKTQAGLKVLFVELPKTRAKPHAARLFDGCTGERGIDGNATHGGVRWGGCAAWDASARNTSVYSLKETWAGLVSGRNDDAAIAHVKGG